MHHIIIYYTSQTNFVNKNSYFEPLRDVESDFKFAGSVFLYILY